MSGKLRATVDLIRLPNLFTAMADPLAGFLYLGGTWSQWPYAVSLMGASTLLYAGGVALNDVCDAARDAVDRPERPIPSGRVSRRAGTVVSLALLAVGVALASSISLRAGIVAIILLAAIILYDAVFKTTVVAPAIMGVCRAANLALGMTVAWSGEQVWLDVGRVSSPDFPTVALTWPVGLIWLYVASVTYFARRESSGGSRLRLGLGTAGVVSAVLGLAPLAAQLAPQHWGSLPLIAILAALVAYYGVFAVRAPQPQTVQRAVRVFILGLVLFDACLAAAARGLVAALLVVALLVPAFLTARTTRVT